MRRPFLWQGELTISALGCGSQPRVPDSILLRGLSEAIIFDLRSDRVHSELAGLHDLNGVFV